MIDVHDLLVHRVLVRDQPAIVDLVHAVLGPLVNARGGAQSLLATLGAYFDTGGVTTESAKRLHVSVRTVAYRLDRIKALTGYAQPTPLTGSPCTRPCSAPRLSTGPSSNCPSRSSSDASRRRAGRCIEQVRRAAIGGYGGERGCRRRPSAQACCQ